ncbi:hypothetical protein [Streptomyces sp. RTd22]|uniref:hypothetical protein n=1 Tax=Streptomyces sp. RTd22 TaxID=1841249 RepID=UPI0007C538A9|nr:hypothetical protein [Streptomyces sp. RTd22]
MTMKRVRVQLDESPVPVEELECRAGRHVRFVGEFLDPYEIASGKEVLPDWRDAYFVIGDKSKAPAENSYFYISDETDLEWEEAAALIEDLPVCLVITHGDMEMGLCPTSIRETGWQWSIVEAYTRLGSLPPVEELYLPERLDLPRSAARVQYLTSAFREGVRREIENYPKRFAKTLELLDRNEKIVIASK